MMGMTTTPVVETIVTRSHFGDNSDAGLIVHAITKGVIVYPRHNTTKKLQHSINNSTGEVSIVTIVITKKFLTVWDRQ